MFKLNRKDKAVLINKHTLALIPLYGKSAPYVAKLLVELAIENYSEFYRDHSACEPCYFGVPDECQCDGHAMYEMIVGE